MRTVSGPVTWWSKYNAPLPSEEAHVAKEVKLGSFSRIAKAVIETNGQLVVGEDGFLQIGGTVN